MEEIQEVEMAPERGDVVIDIDATRSTTEMAGERGHAVTNIDTTGPTTEISEEENNETTEIEDFVHQKLATVPGEPFEVRFHPIPRLPTRFHEADKTYYEPALVSIGPYHHGKGELRAMEEHKWSTLRDFMAQNGQVSFRDYFKEIRPLEQLAREYYGETVNMTSDEFVMMLILDGCFILELFMKLECKQIDGSLFLTGWASSVLPIDMLLLENQVPFFIIHKLFDITVGGGQDCQGHCPVLKLIFKYLIENNVYIQMKLPQEPCHSFSHLRHFYHACMVAEADLKMEQNSLVANRSLPLGSETFSRIKSWFCRQSKREKEECVEVTRVKEEESAKEEEITEENMAKEEDNGEEKGVKEVESIGERYIIIPCVSELCEAGVTFKRKKKPRHMFDISFNNGIMEMPLMEIDSARKIIFSNVVAFEQSQLHWESSTFTSYLALMDALVNTEKDVTLLERCGILDNFFQNEVDAADFFNHFADFNILDYNKHYFRGLFIKVRKYSESTWHKYRARLMRDYFNNPWTIISVVAAGLLLILTIAQTYFTAVSSIHN